MAREGLRSRLLALRTETLAVALAARHPRTPWYAKLIAAATVAYFLSPIDLIPDPIPVLGQLDDLLIVPLGVLLVRRLTPPDVLDECRRRATAATLRPGKGRWIAAAVIVVIWLALLAPLGVLLWRLVKTGTPREPAVPPPALVWAPAAGIVFHSRVDRRGGRVMRTDQAPGS